MYEEGSIKWESVLTILLGIVIVAFIVLLIYRRIKANQKEIEQEVEIRRKNKQENNFHAGETDKNKPYKT